MEEERSYPVRIKCRHDLVVDIQPLRKEDIPILRELHQAMSDEERSLLREDILNPFYEQRVARQIEDEFYLRLVAWHENKIVASLALHRTRPRWLQHTCEMRSITHPDYRRLGVILVLMEEGIAYARSKGIEKLYVNLLPEQHAAINLAKEIGFMREATLKNHAKDVKGNYHDVRIYSIDLEEAHKAMEDMMLEFTPYYG